MPFKGQMRQMILQSRAEHSVAKLSDTEAI